MAQENENTTTPSGQENAGPQARLLDAAEYLFCEQGFTGTTVRDLAAAAGCNIAAVNYYFGSKENLYIKVWRRQLQQMCEARIGSIQRVISKASDQLTLEELLSSFANAFIGPLADEGKARRLIKLMAREMLDQHLPANMFVKEMVIPTMAAMRQALLGVCSTLDESKVPLVVFSIAGQLVHAIRIKAMFEQTDNPEMPMLDLPEVVNHIVKFSAAGIRAYAEGKSE